MTKSMSMESISKDEAWEENLRSLIITILNSGQEVDQSLYAQIGQYYMCYAPATLFKYYSDSPQKLGAVKSNQMWYSAPSEFNDVFDCDIVYDKEKMLESLLQSDPATSCTRPGSQEWRAAKAALNKHAHELQATLAGMKSTMGIACLSESDDSLLMWAHYANNHRGMCVEYELMELNKQLKFTPVPIIYAEDRVCFCSLNQQTIDRDTMRVLIESLTSKSPEWSYEKEWRIIRDENACGDKWNAEKHGALLPMIKPNSVILGCASSQEFRNSVHKHCKENKINLFQMEKDSFHYQLNKKRVLGFDNSTTSF